MVSKKDLRTELSSFNKKLDEHLGGIGVDLFDESILSAQSLSGDQGENLILLTQSLKDIRVEMNLIRKHLSSDTEMMLKSLLNSQQQQFNQEMIAFQERVFKVLKVFDPSKFNEVISEVDRLSKQNESIIEDLNSMKNMLPVIDKKLDVTNDLSINLDVYKDDIKESFNQLSHTLIETIKKNSNKFENFEMNYTDRFENVENQVGTVTSSFNKTDKDLSNLSSKINHIENQLSSVSSYAKGSEKNFSILRNKLLTLDSKVDHSYSDLLSDHKKIEKNLKKERELISSKIEEFDQKLSSQTEELVLLDVGINQNMDGINSRLDSFNASMETKFVNVDEKLSTFNTTFKKDFDKIKEDMKNPKKPKKITPKRPKKESKVIDLGNVEIDLNSSVKQKDSNFEKILDIDKRIKKLSNLL